MNANSFYFSVFNVHASYIAELESEFELKNPCIITYRMYYTHFNFCCENNSVWCEMA